MRGKNWLWLVALIAITAGSATIVWLGKKNNQFRNLAAPKPMWPIAQNKEGKDTAFFTVPEYVAENADGDFVSTKEMDNKITVVETFFSSCQSICPIMNQNMARVNKQFSQNKNFQIFSYSVDYERDDLNTLKVYADNHGADLSTWRFMRSPQDSIFNFGRWGLKIPVGEDEEEGNFLHSERFILIDWNRNIRGYYDGTDSLNVNKMMNDIVLLMSLKDRKYREK